MESGEVNAKRGCGRGAAVEQLTARGMEYQSPQWGAIDVYWLNPVTRESINPRDGGQ